MADQIRLSGKGSKRRPQEVTQDTFASNWDRIFGKKESDVHGGTEAATPGPVHGTSADSVHGD